MSNKNAIANHVAPNFEKTMLYLNFEMIRVDCGDLEKRQLKEIVECMFNLINW